MGCLVKLLFVLLVFFASVVWRCLWVIWLFVFGVVWGLFGCLCLVLFGGCLVVCGWFGCCWVVWLFVFGVVCLWCCLWVGSSLRGSCGFLCKRCLWLCRSSSFVDKIHGVAVVQNF